MNKLLIAFCALLLLASVPAAAENTQRLCTASDLNGYYHIIQLRETPKGEETAWYNEYKNHYFLFNPDHTYRFVATRHAPAKPEDVMRAMMEADSQGSHVLERKYTLDDNGLLNLYIDGKVDSSYRCMIVIKGVYGTQAGDLMLTGYSKKRAELYKLFRHWQ